MTKAARHGCLRTEVYQKLREGILSGQYRRGTSLTEISLCSQLGVSRTPVREAICQLELDGLVTLTPNKSVVVRGFDDQDILDLYEIRHQVETLAAAKAALNMSGDQRRQLQDIFDKQENATEEQNFELLQQIDSDFHKLIFIGSGSMMLQNLLSTLGIYTHQARLSSLTTPGRSRQVLTEHERIMTAILDQNSETARLMMQDHIANAAAKFKTVSLNRR